MQSIYLTVTDVGPGEKEKEKRKQVGKKENGGGEKQKNPSRSTPGKCVVLLKACLFSLSLSQAAVAQ